MPLVLTFLEVWKRKLVSGILPLGNHLRLWDTHFKLERIGLKALYESGIAIWKVLQQIYMAGPTSEELLWIADEFNDICKMPNCIGSIDGKHCCIKCPPNVGSLFFNYKSFHSMNLLGVADANCCFTLIVVGAHECENNSSVFSNSSFGKVFTSGDLNVPPMSNTPGTSISIQWQFLGEEAFPLKSNLMRPFPKWELNFVKPIFNGQLSSTLCPTKIHQPEIF